METDFKNVLKEVKLSEKAFKFFENLTKPDSPTKGDIVNSFHAAGYTQNDTSKYYAYQVYNSAKFQKLLTAYRDRELKKGQNREFTILERTTEDLNFIIQSARLRGDLGTMRQAVVDRGKLHGLFVDRHQVIDSDAEFAIDKAMRLEAAKLAEQRLLGYSSTIEGEIIQEDSTIIEENRDSDAEKGDSAA